jgi:hypothetical protein
MKEWEARLLHARAVVDAYTDHLGAPRVKHPPNACRVVDQTREFHGPAYFKCLSDKGHSAVAFNDCTCSKEFENEMS